MLDDDLLVRMRSADALEKVSSSHPEYLQPLKNRLISEVSQVRQQEVRWHVVQMVRMLQALVTILNGVEVRNIAQNGVEYLDDGRKRRFQEADTVILALGRIPNREAAKVVVGGLDGECIEIGDCVEPRSQMHAIYDDFLAGYGIGDAEGTKTSVYAYLIKEAAYRSPLPRVGPIGEVLNTEERKAALGLPPLVPGQSSW